MKYTASVVITYSLIVLLGGLIGYLTANSLASLIMGSVSGALLFASGLGLYRSSVIAFMTALVMTIVLAIFFGIRYYYSMKMMPAGMMAGFSVIVLLLLLTTKGRPSIRSK